jgi:hypothetical protein
MTYEQYLGYWDDYDSLTDCLRYMRSIEVILADNDKLNDDLQSVKNIISDWESRAEYAEEMARIGEEKYGYDEVI